MQSNNITVGYYVQINGNTMYREKVKVKCHNKKNRGCQA
jgi:hypothetical protein